MGFESLAGKKGKSRRNGQLIKEMITFSGCSEGQTFIAPPCKPQDNKVIGLKITDSLPKEINVLQFYFLQVKHRQIIQWLSIKEA